MWACCFSSDLLPCLAALHGLPEPSDFGRRTGCAGADKEEGEYWVAAKRSPCWLATPRGSCGWECQGLSAIRCQNCLLPEMTWNDKRFATSRSQTETRGRSTKSSIYRSWWTTFHATVPEYLAGDALKSIERISCPLFHSVPVHSYTYRLIQIHTVYTCDTLLRYVAVVFLSSLLLCGTIRIQYGWRPRRWVRCFQKLEDLLTKPWPTRQPVPQPKLLEQLVCWNPPLGWTIEIHATKKMEVGGHGPWKNALWRSMKCGGCGETDHILAQADWVDWPVNS